MDDIISTRSPKARISKEEIARRREVMHQVTANSRLEGMKRGPESDEIFNAYVRGEIEVTDIVPRLKAQLGLS